MADKHCCRDCQHSRSSLRLIPGGHRYLDTDYTCDLDDTKNWTLGVYRRTAGSCEKRNPDGECPDWTPEPTEPERYCGWKFWRWGKEV